MMRDLLERKVGVQSTGRVVGIISATGINDLLGRLELIEKKDKVVGIVSSTAIALVLFLVLLFWFANAGLVMGIDEPEWKTIGLISPGADYGTDMLGQKDINNFYAPSENAANRPPAPASSDNSSSATASNAASATPAASGAITQTKEDVGVTANAGKENTNPTPNSNATGTGDGKPTKTPGTTNGGGSNDGETGQVGNTGNPEATVLNENGLFKFGNGIGGAGGRKPIRTKLEGYNIQLEEKITFEITIDPNGDVIFAKAPNAIHQELVAIGKANFKNWKFSETDPGAGNLKTTVVIAFRLK
jgi:hypothetical protein